MTDDPERQLRELRANEHRTVLRLESLGRSRAAGALFNIACLSAIGILLIVFAALGKPLFGWIATVVLFVAVAVLGVLSFRLWTSQRDLAESASDTLRALDGE